MRCFVVTYICESLNSCVDGNCCRNAKNMPDGVRAALKRIIVSASEMTDDEADKYLEELDRTGRYQTETWS